MKDLKQRVIRGGLARILTQLTMFVLRIGSFMVLARILTPMEFGLVGMVTAVIGVLNLFRDFGLSTASVQRPTVSHEQFSTLFWINMLVGGILAILSLGVAPLVARFYDEPRLQEVTAVLAAGFLFNAAGVQHTAILERELRFTAIAVIDMLALLTSSAIGIGMAMMGYGYWSLVAMTVASPLVSTLCAWVSTGWIPGRPRKRVGIRSMVRFGGTVTLNGLVVYVAYNLEKVLLGRFWGAEATGIYGRAYQLIRIPIDNLNSAVGGVAFSALSRVQDDPKRFRSYFLRGYSLVLSLTIPSALVCAVFADQIILVVLGPQWTDAVPILRFLAPTIVVFALINPLGWLLLSLGMVGRSLRVALVLAPVVIVGYLIGLPYGPKGVALGYSAMMVAWVIPHIAWCVRGTLISLRDIFQAASRPLVSGSISGLLAFGAHSMLASSMPPLAMLALGGAILLGVHFVILMYVMGEKDAYLDLVRSLRGSRSVTTETKPVSS